MFEVEIGRFESFKQDFEVLRGPGNRTWQRSLEQEGAVLGPGNRTWQRSLEQEGAVLDQKSRF